MDFFKNSKHHFRPFFCLAAMKIRPSNLVLNSSNIDEKTPQKLLGVAHAVCK